MIYVSLLIVWYKKNLPLRSPASVPSDDDKDKEGSAIESLFFELEAATIDKKERDRYENVGLDRGDEESIRELEETENREDPKSLLEDIFRRADVDENQLLDIQELAKWIHSKITEHVRRAMRDNIGLFTAIDNNPRNGKETVRKCFKPATSNPIFPSVASIDDRRSSAPVEAPHVPM